jgi:spore germination protein KB
MPVKITNNQLFMLIFMFAIGNSLLMYVHSVIHAAKQDAWISCLIALVPGLAISLIAIKTGLYNPELTFLHNCRKLLGKWAGTAVVVVYLVQWVTMLGNIVTFASDFIIILLLEQTPNWVFVLSLLLLSAYAVIADGIRSLGRLSELYGIVSLFGLLMLILMLIPHIRMQNMLPIYEDNGMGVIVRAAIYPLVFKAEAVWLLAIASFIEKPDKAVKTVFWGKLTAFVVGTLNLLFVILVLSPEVASLQLYPAFDMVSLISVMNFVQNLEIILVLAWLMSVFIRMSVYLFLASHTAAELFRVQNWKRIVWVVIGIAMFQAWISLKYKIEILPILGKSWMVYVFPWTMGVFPVVLFAAGFIRQRLAQKRLQSGL